MNREEETPSHVPTRDRQDGEDLWQRYGAERGVWSEPMLIALEKGIKGNKRFSLMDKIQSERTLGIAWKQVRANAGACGVDGIKVEFFEKDIQRRLLAVNEHLTKNTYRPSAIRRVYIPKAGSNEKRPLGIPTVADRVVQAAVKMVIEPIFESRFSANSYGFRPGRGAKDALRQVENLLKEGFTHVVDIDIKGYFDNIPHERLMQLVKDRIADRRVLGLIEQFLTQAISEEGKETIPSKGSPQGGVISPLLANIYLDPLDHELEARGIHFARYADDLVILVRSKEEAEATLLEVRHWMEQAQLELHPEKTRVVDMTQSRSYFDFLGYRFMRTQKGKLIRLVRPKSEKKLRDGIRPLTRRTIGISINTIIAMLNPKLRGWCTYFMQAHQSVLEKMDQWVRGRLRSILRKRHKGRGRGRGMDHHRWPNRYFEEQGLYSLLEAQNQKLMSLRSKGAKC